MNDKFEATFAKLCEYRDRLYDEDGERRMTVEKALDIYTDIVNHLTHDEKKEFYELTSTIRLLDGLRNNLDYAQKIDD